MLILWQNYLRKLKNKGKCSMTPPLLHSSSSQDWPHRVSAAASNELDAVLSGAVS